MKVQSDANMNLSKVSLSEVMEHKEMTIKADRQRHFILHSPDRVAFEEIDEGSQPDSTSVQNSDGETPAAIWGNNAVGVEDTAAEISEDSSSTLNEDDDLSYELQQAHRILHGFLLEKHKGVTAPFMQPLCGGEETGDGDHGKRPVCFRRIEEKFLNREYESITEFVADFRLMLENCYRYHGVDHWISKQAQKLEIMLEQKLTLLSRTLREKTTLAVTSKGRFGTEEEKGPGTTSTRRRSTPRNLTPVTVGVSESLMVQVLRLEEQQRAKEEKRLREQEKKEAEEASAKELDDWERSLLANAAPWSVETLWELPAVGHFLCLAQTVLNLPEIVFFELERCLLMPRCSTFLAKVMTSLLCHPQRRATLHRRPPFTYRRWEAALRHKVSGWYQLMGQSEDTAACAEQLGLSPQFFQALGETSPLEEKPFHQLPFDQRVWLLKGLCDFVYENQKEVQDAVLSQPIHECRESILGYDGRENAYIHFPHFCGADLRIYCQSPSTPPKFPPPAIRVRRLEKVKKVEAIMQPEGPTAPVENEKKDMKNEPACFNSEMKERENMPAVNSWGLTDHQYRLDLQIKAESAEVGQTDIHSPCGGHFDSCDIKGVKIQSIDVGCKAETKVEHLSLVAPVSCDPGVPVADAEEVPQTRSSAHPGEIPRNPGLDRVEGNKFPTDIQEPACGTDEDPQLEYRQGCSIVPLHRTAPSESPRPEGCAEGKSSRTRTKKKKRKKKKMKEEGGPERRGKSAATRPKVTKMGIQKSTAAQKKKGKRKKLRAEKKFDSKKLTSKKRKTGPKLPAEPKFQLVCSSVEELRVLISKTEDELEELESTRKKSGKWYSRRQAVKELHITLIRLLNELSPWESKIIKAFQRNRARLKKDYEDFRKHPEYHSFVREEWLEDDRDGVVAKDGHSSDNPKATERAEKLDQVVKKDAVKTEDTKQQAVESSRRTRTPRQETVGLDEHRTPFRIAKRAPSGNADEELRKKLKITGEEQASPAVPAEVKESNPTVESLVAETSKVAAPMAVFLKGSKPIQALLAKSIGNKVTLISQPAAAAMVNQNKSEIPQKMSKPLASPGKALQSSFTPKSLVQSPVQGIYKISDGMDLLGKSTSPEKIALQPVLDQKIGKKAMQQVVILPTMKEPLHHNITTVSVSKPSATLSDAPGKAAVNNTNKVPIQQVSPLPDACNRKPLSSAVISTLPTSPKTYYAGNSVCQAGPAPSDIQNRLSLTSLASASPSKSDSKQELKTVCIRDSQSILVTTRGGNTGVVKVQTSDQSVSGFLASSPIITISPHLQAFLVSKSSPSVAASTVVSSTTETTTSSAPSSLSSSLTNCVSPCPSAVSIPVSAGQRVGNIVNFALNQTQDSVSAPLTASKCNITTQALTPKNSTLPVVPQTNLNLPTSSAKSDLVVTQTSSTLFATQPLTTMAQPAEGLAERPSMQRVILVAPSSTIATSAVTAKVPPTSSTVPAPRLIFISQASSSVEQPLVSIPKKTTSSDSMAISLTSTSQIADMKIGLNLSQAIVNTTSSLQKVPTSGLSDLSNKLRAEAFSVGLPVAGSDSKCTPVTASKVSVVETASGGKAVTFPALKAGNLVSSTLPVLSQQHSALSPRASLIPSVGKTATAQSEGSSLKSVVASSVKSLVNKDCALIPKAPTGTTIPGLVFNKPQFQASAMSKPVPFKISPVILPPVLQSQDCTSPSKSFSTTPSAPQAAQHAIVPPPYESNTMQQKILINTATPLSPGSHIVINNTRFIVPAQGLGPGSHMLLISSPVVPLSTPQGPSLSSTSQRGPATSVAAAPVLSAGQNPRKYTPSTQPLHGPYIPPSPSSVKLGSSYTCSTPQMTVVANTTKSPLPTGNTTSVAQVPQLFAVASTLCQTLPNSQTAPSALSAEAKGSLATLCQAASNQMKEAIPLASQMPGSPPGATKAAPWQIGLANVVASTKLTPAVPTVGAIISRTQVLPTSAVPPFGSTVSRIQSLPVATVLPVGSTFNRRQASPIATVPPSNNTVIVASGQSVRTAIFESSSMTPGQTILSQTPSKPSSQVSTPAAVTSASIDKLMVSPEGAVLNAIRSPAVSSLPTASKTSATVVVTHSSGTGRVLPSLKTDDPLTPAHAEKARPSD
ncbi:uncharacterized protein KIAA2026 isoform X2 [Brienomyrus brachyistius]|uniref:uncharacterized protein KIAA2026 isoform X2 n=1 Tax=Brienomyrus brachyistius TaxID=42636 RepID=UPI0020B3D404|nr:uncharacterized protein KIAA2026 isoform X2 [Brienomyrus brachyistius]